MLDQMYQIVYWGAVPVYYLQGEYRTADIEAAIRHARLPANPAAAEFLARHPDVMVAVVRLPDDTVVATYYYGHRRTQLHFRGRDPIAVMLQAVAAHMARGEPSEAGAETAVPPASGSVEAAQPSATPFPPVVLTGASHFM